MGKDCQIQECIGDPGKRKTLLAEDEAAFGAILSGVQLRLILVILL